MGLTTVDTWCADAWFVRALRAIVLCSAAATVFSGCATPHIDPPTGFLTLIDRGSSSRDPNSQRVTSADGAKLWVRAFDDPARGSLEFWTKALEHEFVNQRGYQLVGQDEVTDSAKRAGVAFEFRTFAAGEPHGYLIALFVGDGELRTVEFVAPTGVFETHLGSVRAALSSVR